MSNENDPFGLLDYDFFGIEPTPYGRKEKYTKEGAEQMKPNTLGIIGKTTDWLKNVTADVDDLAGSLSLGPTDTKEQPTLYKMYFALCEIATNANNLSKIVLDEINKEQGE